MIIICTFVQCVPDVAVDSHCTSTYSTLQQYNPTEQLQVIGIGDIQEYRYSSGGKLHDQGIHKFQFKGDWWARGQIQV
jgi:hypothetical protein